MKSLVVHSDVHKRGRGRKERIDNTSALWTTDMAYNLIRSEVSKNTKVQEFTSNYKISSGREKINHVEFHYIFQLFLVHSDLLSVVNATANQ